MTDRANEVRDYYKSELGLELLPSEVLEALERAEEYAPDAFWEGDLRECVDAVEWEFILGHGCTVKFWRERGEPAV